MIRVFLQVSPKFSTDRQLESHVPKHQKHQNHLLLLQKERAKETKEEEPRGPSKKVACAGQHNHSIPQDQHHHTITFFICNISPRRFFICIVCLLGQQHFARDWWGGASKKTVQQSHSLPKDQQQHSITFFICNMSPRRFFICIFPILGSATMLQTIIQKKTDTHPVEHTCKFSDLTTGNYR